ncbi:MAG: hypothetical protein ACI3T9_01020 [Romboutsia timonensis]
MNIVESWIMDPIYGVTIKNENYYVIRDKETHEFDCRDGELTEDIMEANWYQHYKEAKHVLTNHFDEPEKFEVIRFSCTTRLEEVM